MSDQPLEFENWEDLKKLIPDEAFVEKVEKGRKLRPEICLIILREVVDPVLARNSDPERAELFISIDPNNREIVRARVNGEKFTSVERLTGLNLCRILNDLDQDQWNIISPTYLYNEMKGGLILSINPDTVIYGGAGVEKGNTFSIKSRVIEGYTYTLEPYNLLNKEQHNALFETGTMIKVGNEDSDENEQGKGLYTHVNIEPPTKMIHFIRIEAPTKEMILYVLYNVLNSSNYFARSTRKGCIRNSLLGMIFSKTSIGLSSGELIKEEFSNSISTPFSITDVKSKINSYIERHKNTYWNFLPEENELTKTLQETALMKNQKTKEILKQSLIELTKQAKDSYVSSNVSSTDKTDKKNSTRKPTKKSDKRSSAQKSLVPESELNNDDDDNGDQ